jgi:hypothetical protein
VLMSFYYIYESKQEVSQVVREEDSNHISSEHSQCTSNGTNKHLVVNWLNPCIWVLAQLHGLDVWGFSC